MGSVCSLKQRCISVPYRFNSSNPNPADPRNEPPVRMTWRSSLNRVDDARETTTTAYPIIIVISALRWILNVFCFFWLNFLGLFLHVVSKPRTCTFSSRGIGRQYLARLVVIVGSRYVLYISGKSHRLYIGLYALDFENFEYRPRLTVPHNAISKIIVCRVTSI